VIVVGMVAMYIATLAVCGWLAAMAGMAFARWMDRRLHRQVSEKAKREGWHL
jgi:hypothetical protein